jgi:hypothetical protein
MINSCTKTSNQTNKTPEKTSNQKDEDFAIPLVLKIK